MRSLLIISLFILNLKNSLSLLFRHVDAPPVLFTLILVGMLDFTSPLIFFFSLIITVDFSIPNIYSFS